MNRSEKIANLAMALLKAQKSMGGAVKGAKNPFFKSKYADYGAVLEVVKEPLNEAGVIVLQPTRVVDGKTYVETSLVHAESGEYMSGDTEVLCAKPNDPQAYGSAITYARRYGLQSLLSIPSEDDDANSASGKETSVDARSSAAPAESSSTPPAKSGSWRRPGNSSAPVEPKVPAAVGEY